MAWTLVLAIVIVTYVIVAVFSKTFRIFQRKAFVYPSAAEIDQILPPEIIETILSNVDLNTLLACSTVSKYWRYHAEKDYVFKSTLEREKAPRATLAEVAADLEDPSFQIQWLTYLEDHYKPAWHVQDARYVRSTGRKLIDATLSCISKLSKSTEMFVQNKDGICPVDKYIVRTRLKYSFASGSNHYFYTREGNEFVYIQGSSIPEHVKKDLRYGVELEIVEKFWRASSMLVLANPDSARIVETRNFVGGVPIDGALFGLLYLVFLPCFVKDFWSASAETKSSLTFLWAIVGLIGTIIISSIVLNDGVPTQGPRTKKARLYFGLEVLGTIFFSAFFYRQSLEIGFFCASEAGLFMFGLFVFILYDQKHPNATHVLFVSFCLVVSVIDWKLTVDAAKDGSLLYSFLYNLAMHALLWLWTVFINIFAAALSTWSITLRVDKTIHKLFGLAILSVLFITCAAPYTVRKVSLQ